MTAGERGTAGRCVLVVDDDRDAAEMLSLLLESRGYRVTVAHDGPSALRLLAARAMDAVLLDIGLPSIRGDAVARRIRERWGAALLLVAVTGRAASWERDELRGAGFDDVLPKPLNLERLEALLRRGPGEEQSV